MALVAAGQSDKQIAVELEISIHTVRSYLNRIFRRHTFHNRAEAAAAFERYLGADSPDLRRTLT